LKKTLVLLTIILSVSFLSACGGANGIVLKAENEEITQDVFDFYFNSTVNYLTERGIDPEQMGLMGEVENQTYDTCRYMAEIRALAKKEGLTVTGEQIEKAFEEEKASFESEEAFQTWMEENKVSEDVLDWLVESSLYYEALMNKVSSGIAISDEEAAEVYNQNPDDYDKIKTSHILIKADSAGEANQIATAKSKAQSLVKELENGADFATLAKENSEDTSAEQGGVFDYYITKNDSDIFSQYRDAAWQLKNIGDYTHEPIQSPAGFHIIKLDEKKVGLSYALDDIKTELLSAKQTQAFSEYFTAHESEIEIEEYYKFKYQEETTDGTTTDGTATDGTATDGTTTDGTTTDGTATDGTADNNAK